MQDSDRLSASTLSVDVHLVSPPLKPSIRLLFSLLKPTHVLFVLFPAIFLSILAGLTAPFMTFVIGQNFDAFAAFPLTSQPPESAKRALLHAVALSSLELVGIAVITLALGSITSTLWVWIGESNLLALRTKVYQSVSTKELYWFDLKLGTDGDKGPLGAGGLMAQFSRESDEVRTASSIAASNVIQYLTTIITCIVIAFARSPALAPVILATIPVVIVIQGVSQGLAMPFMAAERREMGTVGTLIDRAVNGISTVKAFNAQSFEASRFSAALSRQSAALRKMITVWSSQSAFTQAVGMCMFVQAFWFGAKFVREHKISPGEVMTVFWACLTITNSLQTLVPYLTTFSQGKTAMASLLSLCESSTARTPRGPHKLRRRSTPTSLRKIRPERCAGEISMHSISFAYPSRPQQLVLSDVSLYLPANEMTFIVGGSGSGKSTVAALLLRMYSPTSGRIEIDDQDIRYLDDTWMKQHVAGVSQECTLFDGSVHENVAIGLDGAVTREEVIEACRAALMHEFVRDLPEDYDTALGNEGAALSGGQRQRLAIARAHLRNPSILILDEATSALDATSRILVFEALKRWRKNKTTVVITHDLSQITSEDFVYVLKGGEIVEQGYRADLEIVDGSFKEMAEIQGQTGGFLPEKVIASEGEEVDAMLEDQHDDGADGADYHSTLDHRSTMGHVTMRPITPSHWIFQAISNLTTEQPQARRGQEENEKLARFSPLLEPIAEGPRRPSSVHIIIPEPERAQLTPSRRLSLQFTPTSPSTASPVFPWSPLPHSRDSVIVFTNPWTDAKISWDVKVEDDGAFEKEKRHVKSSGTRAVEVRMERRDRNRSRMTLSSKGQDAPIKKPAPDAAATPSFVRLMKQVYHTLPLKGLLFLGFILCILSGAMTPLFSFLLSRLLFEVSIGATRISYINQYGVVVLGVIAADGLLMFLKEIIVQAGAVAWITRLRTTSFRRIMVQDKKWFDQSENSAPNLIQTLVKDGDDARSLISTIVARLFVVITMLGFGLTWALIRGWQLTLVGIAIVPVFAGVMAFITGQISKCEARNKAARVEVAKKYYEVVSSIRGIRSMSLEKIFDRQFDVVSDKARRTGVRGAWIEGSTNSVANALIYLAEALLFYVGAVLIARGTYSYLQMVEVLNLVVFSVTLGSQMLDFTQKIPRSLQATRAFMRLMHLSTDTDEGRGELQPVISGPITFNDVSFTYPERPDVQVLKNASFEIDDGECVAVVGASGSGKSTVASLLQRLYEPNSGKIYVGEDQVQAISVDHLRSHVSVVSQNPTLFDATVAENIAYGNDGLSAKGIEAAAQAANMHDFIMSLPKGYETTLGEKASLISGGQAQRLQIARALARPCKVLILDECTSALDAANQAAIMETIQKARVGRTTMVITHKVQMMQMCDRILVVQDGEIVESGPYDELMTQNGVFATLARGGEWSMD